MSNSKYVLDKLAKLFEQGIVNYKDLSNEILNVLKSKRDELIFKMRLTSKEETDVLIQRINNLEKLFRTRWKALGLFPAVLEQIKKEVDMARNTFKKYKWPSIDVTRKSVEETAASVIKIYEIYKGNA